MKTLYTGKSRPPYNTLKEFMEASRQTPGKLKLGISMGGSSYIAAIIMEKDGASFVVVDSGDGGRQNDSFDWRAH